MKIKIFLIFLLFSNVFLEKSVARTYEYISADYNQFNKIDKNIVILPEKIIKSYDPITIFFKKELQEDAPHIEKTPEKYVKSNIISAGEYRWIDNKTLQFRPAVFWESYKIIEINVEGIKKKIYTLLNKPKLINPQNNSLNNNPTDKIVFYTVDNIKKNLLENNIFIEIVNSNTVEKEKKFLDKNSFFLKKYQQKINNKFYKYVIKLNSKIPESSEVKLKFRISLDTANENDFVEYKFSTKKTFKVVSIGSSNNHVYIPVSGVSFLPEQSIKLSSENFITIKFSESIKEPKISDVKNFIKFEPELENLSFEKKSDKLIIYGDFRKNKFYKVSLDKPDIYDVYNRKLNLKNKSEIYFSSEKKSELLKVTDGNGTAELYGPKFFPVKCRNLEKCDLRIYKIDPLSPDFWPFSDVPVKVNETADNILPGQEPKSNDYSYTTSSKIIKHIKLLNSPLVSKIITNRDFKDDDLTYLTGLNIEKYFESILPQGVPGAYLIGLRTLDSDVRQYFRLDITDLSLTVIENYNSVIFFVTSLKTGEPVADANIILQVRPYSNDSKKKWVNRINGITDREGKFVYIHKRRISADLKRLIVKKNNDTLIINPTKSPEYFYDNHWYNTYSYNWLYWLKNTPTEKRETNKLFAHLITDRKLYKPNEKIFIKGFLRKKENGNILGVEDFKDNFYVKITGPNKFSWTKNVILNEFSNFDFAFQKNNLPTGNYYIRLYSKNKFSVNKVVSFKVQSYRIPKFEVNMFTSSKISLDEKCEVSISGKYYSGGKVVNRPVRWNITQNEYYHYPKNFGKFKFSTDSTYSAKRYKKTFNSIFKNTLTNSSGNSKIVLDPTLEKDGLPRLYTVEATVKDIDGQSVSKTKNIVALPNFSIGIKQKKLEKSSEKIVPEIVAVDFNDTFVSGIPIRVKLIKREWHSYLQETNFSKEEIQDKYDIVDEAIYDTKIISKKDIFKLDLGKLTSGVYIIELQGNDKLGRLQSISTDFFVAGNESVSWERDVDKTFEIVPDKKIYNPGDNANILIKSPFQTAKLLVITEFPEKTEYKWVNVENGKAIYRLNVKENFVPKLPINFLLIHGRNSDYKDIQNSKHDRDKPKTVGAFCNLNINPINNKLNLKLTHKKKVLPGKEFELKLKLTDYKNEPVKGEITLWLVDKAVLALSEKQNIDPLSYIISSTGSELRISDFRNYILGRVFTRESVIGGGANFKKSKALFELLKQKNTVRKNFQTVPYYNPSIVTDANGEKTVKIKVSDNLTEFIILAVVSDKESKFGYANSSVEVRLPVIIKNSFPRFVRIGDKIEAGGIVQIIEGDTDVISCSIEINEGKILRENFIQKTVGKYTPEKFYFPIKINDAKTNDFFTVRMDCMRKTDKAGDAFEIKLPLKYDRKFDVEYKKLLFDKNNVADLNPEFSYRKGSLERSLIITVFPEIINVANSLNYLSNYPHPCLEQKISRLLPVLVLKEHKSKNGLNINYNLKNLNIEDLIEYCKLCLDNNGLYSYYPGSEGSVFLTAYTLRFLAKLKKTGYKIEDKLFYKPLIYLQDYLRLDETNYADAHMWDEKIEILDTLFEAEQFDEYYLSKFYDKVNYISLYYKAKFLKMLVELKYKKSKIKKLTDDILEKIPLSQKNGKIVFNGFENEVNFNNNILLESESKTIAQILSALYKVNVNDKKKSLLKNYLMEVADESGWGNTNTNADIIKNMLEILDLNKFSEIKTNTYELIENNKSKSFKISKKQASYFFNTKTQERIFLKRKKINQDNYSVIRLTYLKKETGDKTKAINNGLSINNAIVVYDTSNKEIKQIVFNEPGKIYNLKTDNIIEVHSQFIIPEDNYNVVITVPFAAGLEPMNTNLKTSSAMAETNGKNTLKESYSQFLDDEVKYYYNVIKAGTYDFYFRLKPISRGEYIWPASYAELMYRPEINGNSNGCKVIIK